MFLSKVKFAAIVLLAVGIAGSGAGFQENRAIAPAPAKAAQDSPALPDKLDSTIDYPGIDDARATLSDVLDHLAKHHNLTFDINKMAFEMENFNDVARTPIAETAIPPMHATLSTVLHKVLARLPQTPNNRVTFLIRRDVIEITTELFVRAELGITEKRPLLPLVWNTLDNTPIDAALRKLARQSGYNVAIDPRIADKVQTPATAKLDNVPIDTGVRLLANMAGMSVVRLDNVFYVTTADNAKKLNEDQAKINADAPAKTEEAPKKPEAKKPAK